MNLLEVDGLCVTFHLPGTRHRVRAVDGVSFAVGERESVGLVGESGCGKSSLANAIVGIVPVSAGRIRVDGRDLTTLSRVERMGLRRRIQMVFQDPFGSLNPRLTVGSAMTEVLQVHGLAKGRQAQRRRVAELLDAVGLSPGYARRYPHEFSGGQRQRIGIARALAVEPALILADEPVSALDVSVQVQILNLMRDLQRRIGLSYLFIAHDLGVVRYVCDRVLVMYLGRIVESGPVAAVLGKPAHPYTEALISAVPDVERGLLARKHGRTRIVLKGEVPSHAAPIAGCPFHPRCLRCEVRCRSEAPEPHRVAADHFAVCHFA